MSSKLPFFQFFVSDWYGDTRPLSLAAKGAWIDILCNLHHSVTRGSSTLPMVAWARVISASVDQAAATILEITNMRVCDSVQNAGNDDVTLICRRMLRESLTREQTRLRVNKHRLSLGDAQAKEACNATCNTPGNRVVTDIIHNSEFRTTPKPPPGFGEFWLNYPNKTGKGAAEKRWRQLKPEISEVLAALQWQTKSEKWKKDRGQFVPNPATYLSAKGWLDEPPKASELKLYNPGPAQVTL